MAEKKKAAALKYERGKDSAPRVVARGKGAVAEKIIELAKKHNIPVIQDTELVSLLVNLDPGEEIPPALYRAVAKILALIYSVTRRECPSE
jgi:flagellar biosynthesis protein